MYNFMKYIRKKRKKYIFFYETFSLLRRFILCILQFWITENTFKIIRNIEAVRSTIEYLWKYPGRNIVLLGGVIR